MKLIVWLLLGVLVLIATGTFALIQERHAKPEDSRLDGEWAGEPRSGVEIAKLERASEPAPQYVCSNKFLHCPTRD